MTIWDSEEILTIVEKMWNEQGYSAAVIASILTKKTHQIVTRNMVIGKVSRMGWRRYQGTNRRKVAPKRTKTNGTIYSRRRKPNTYSIMRPATDRMANEQRPHFPAEDAPRRPVITIDRLTGTTCRWPFGDPKLPSFGYCGCVCHAKDVYCDEHAARARNLRQPIAVRWAFT